MLTITLKGMEEVDKQLKRVARGAAAMARTTATVGSNMPYAYGAEFGRHRVSRKLARKSGPSYYLTDAMQEVTSGADRDLSEGLKKVTAPGPWVIKRLALWVKRAARKKTPRGGAKKSTYRLRKTIRYFTRRR